MTTPNERDTVARTAISRPRNAALWILQGLAAAGFLLAAAGKLGGDPRTVATFTDLGWPEWTRYALAGLEILGAVALLIPRLTVLAATAFVALTCGALVVQLVTGQSPVMAAVLLVVSAVIAWNRRGSIRALITSLRAAAARDHARP